LTGGPVLTLADIAAHNAYRMHRSWPFNRARFIEARYREYLRLGDSPTTARQLAMIDAGLHEMLRGRQR
jgi:hypothetical protein